MKRTYIFLAALTVLASCSVNKKIGRLAKTNLLDDPALRNAHTGISIYDLTRGAYLYNFQGDKYFVPASNTKLLSCYAAMKYLGDSLPGIQYQILNDTTVLIKGTGDPTILHRDFPVQPVYDFLKKFTKVVLAPTGFDAFMGNGWAWDDYMYDYAAPRSAMPLYGNYMRINLKEGGISADPPFFNKDMVLVEAIKDGFSVNRPWNENKFFITEGRSIARDIPFVPDDHTLIQLLSDTLHLPVARTNLTPLGTNFVYTQPLDSMLSVMMHRSDNFFAEQSLLMVSEKLLDKMDDDKIIKRLLDSDFAGMPQKPRWADGSGLSPYNLISPEDFVFVLNKLQNDFGLDRLKTILPTGGTGTLSSLYKTEAGKIFAKTGTISGVVSLSGYLITKKNHLLLFSVLVNNHNSSAGEIRKRIEQFLKGVMRKS